jgi:hypothetical protein
VSPTRAARSTIDLSIGGAGCQSRAAARRRAAAQSRRRAGTSTAHRGDARDGRDR